MIPRTILRKAIVLTFCIIERDIILLVISALSKKLSWSNFYFSLLIKFFKGSYFFAI